MLLTLMSNLNMFSPVTPPSPTPTIDPDGALPFEYEHDKDHLRRKKIKKTNDEIFIIVNSFLVCQN